ncbi:zinc finger protein 22-like isoform X2 [Cydia fagiglandana]|uniref:zinc finger protein 22-like isoform X2 n=1 Tax=Cydia fagiglandana TaxID=1458189 RepID=UPI002FEDEC81
MDNSIALTMENVLRNDSACRICLVQGEGMQALFVEGNGIIEQIEYCTGIRLLNEPTLPSHICPPCLTHLSIAHSFKSTCLSSHHTLHPHAQTLVNTDVKIERDDDWVKVERKSKRIKMKKEKEDSPDPEPDPDPDPPSPEPDIKPPKCKLTYNKVKGRRPKKFKFKRLWCETCEIKFDSKEESDAHRLAKHPEDPWMCEVSRSMFAHRGSHYTHVRSPSPLHGCAHCDYKTWHRHDLVKHLRIHAGVKQYQCTQCARTFHTSSNLVSHVRRLHDRARPHQCSQCQRRFFDKTKLRRHMDSHNDVKRFECEVCHSCFTRRCYWKKHLQKMHGITVPPQRPGRQKVNFLVGEELIRDTDPKCEKSALTYSLAPRSE